MFKFEDRSISTSSSIGKTFVVWLQELISESDFVLVILQFPEIEDSDHFQLYAERQISSTWSTDTKIYVFERR